MDLKFVKNTADLDDLLNHLIRNDLEFTPKLSSRVQMDLYSEKIFENADRYEVFFNNSLSGLIAVYKTMDRWHITSVSVDRSLRGSGVAGRLLGALIEDGRRTSPAIQLEVNQKAAQAISLYTRLGFRIKNSEDDILFMEFDYCREEEDEKL